MDNSLHVHSIQSGYRSKKIIHDTSFVLHEMQLCGLLGLNGCGKSTLIKTLCGLIRADSGQCIYEERNLWDLNEKERASYVAYIPQRGSTIHGRTALDVVLMGFNPKMGIFDSYSKTQVCIARETMKKLEIESFEERLYEQLSEGQKQLVILARTLVQNTPLVFMDEPDSALDFTNKSRILEKVRTIIKDNRKIGLIALHDADAALDFCDRLLLMKDGRIIKDLKREDFSDYEKLEEALSEIYGRVRIIDNNGHPVMVRVVNL